MEKPMPFQLKNLKPCGTLDSPTGGVSWWVGGGGLVWPDETNDYYTTMALNFQATQP